MARWTRRIRVAAAAVLHVCAALVSGLLIAAAVLVWRPELALTPPILARAAQVLGKAYHPRWSALDLRLASESLARKRLTISARDLCVDDSSGVVKACFDSIEAQAAVRFSLRGVELVTLRRFDARSRSLEVDLSKAPPAEPGARRARFHRLNSFVPRALRRVRVEELDWRLPNTTLDTASSTITGDMFLSYSTGLVFSAQLFYDTPAKSENLDIRMKADSDLFTTGRLTRFDASGTLDGDVDDHARFVVSAAQAARRRTGLKARVSFESGGRRATARLDGQATPDRYSGRLAATVADPAGPLREITAAPCDIDAPVSSEGAVERVSVRCRLSAPLPSFGGIHPKRVDGTADLTLRVKPRPLQPDRFEASLRAAAAPPKDWYEARATVEADVTGRLGDISRTLETRHDVEASIKVASFQDVVKFLRGTRYAVPAPFHVLTGPVTATLSSRGDPRAADQEAVYHAAADLTSGRQTVRAHLDGRLTMQQAFTPQRRLEDRTEVTLDDVALELPYLKLGKIPPMNTDPRIRTGEEPPAPPPAAITPAANVAAPLHRSTAAVEYVLLLKTAKPITLYTNLNPTPVPISLDLTARPAGLAGTINVEPFDARLFKRDGQVDHVTLSVRPGSTTMPINGLIKFRESSIDVSLILLGTTDKPKVYFESEPPLDQQQIIALLLFGKPPNDLDPDQTTTVSNSQSAMAQGAFGLASLYLFASTPVQYVGYDPGTQTYAMRFSLPGGASVEVGTASDQTKHVTLSKRLASHWIIETELQRDPDQQRNAVSTFLEWFQRY